MADMESEWLTYQQAAERLGCSPEAIRQKAIRGRWQKTIGDDKRPLIRLPDGWINAVRTAVEKAIEAFSALAQRLEAMAAQHAIKPWWRRLLRRAG